MDREYIGKSLFFKETLELYALLKTIQIRGEYCFVIRNSTQSIVRQNVKKSDAVRIPEWAENDEIHCGKTGRCVITYILNRWVNFKGPTKCEVKWKWLNVFLGDHKSQIVAAANLRMLLEVKSRITVVQRTNFDWKRPSIAMGTRSMKWRSWQKCDGGWLRLFTG